MKSPMASTMRSPMASPVRDIKDRYKVESAETDVVDPIYENKDPISVAFKTRKDEGGILSVKSTKPSQPFFFTLKLNGNGLKIDEKARQQALAKSP